MRQIKITQSVHTRDSIALEKYLQEISKIPFVTPEEEVTLAQKIKQGDEKSLERLVNANLRFVVSVAKKYLNQGMALPDMINEGNIGLIKAAQRFDETKGFKFISYAVWWIRQSIKMAMSEQARVVRIPIAKHLSWGKINRAAERFEQEHERMPTTEELSEMLEMNEDEIIALVGSNQYHTSTDAPMPGYEDKTLGELMKGYEKVDSLLIQESMAIECNRRIQSLKGKEVVIMEHLFGLNGKNCMTLEDLAQRFDLTSERIRQIKEKAIDKLRSQDNKETLKEFLG